ncbi:hypothetical protein [Bradyrhizobium sp. SZCCHNR2032]|uniref:spike base protein, RCAP_Rcc01079 family n=1 Tax=Bradyrhizobium sp. SZCCHNR2032 TaxID=3057384 RepID=UPI002916E3B0|nr:hypothetical protein [Bradyrhizobium sp. SZCCHNR2032]
MADPYKNAGGDLQSFGRRGTVVTPGSSDLPNIAKGLVVLAAGDATIIPVDNVDSGTLSFTGLSAGAVIPYQVRRVTAATATLATIEG